MSATGGPLDVPAPPSGLTAADLLQKLQMSRAAQHAAVALAASKASASASSETANPLMRAFVLRPSSGGGGGGGGNSSSSKGGDGEKGKRHSPLGFNSFMLEGLAGWRTELLSRRLRQAVVTEFCATGVFIAGGLLTIMASAPSLGGLAGRVEGVTTSGLFPLAPPFTGVVQVVVSGNSTTTATPVSLSFLTPQPRETVIALSFGFLITILVFSTGAISGGNLNPAVTLALFLQGKMSGLRALLYMVAQCLGAIGGAYYAYSLSPQLFMEVGGGVNNIDAQVFTPAWGGSWWSALGMEICCTALLVFTVSAASDVGRERKYKYVGALTPLMIGVAVLVGHIMLIPIDGCSLNPARSLASSIVMNRFPNHYVFWLGPLIGGPLAAILYDRFFFTGEDDAPTVRPLNDLSTLLAQLQARRFGTSTAAAATSTAGGAGAGAGAAAAAAGGAGSAPRKGSTAAKRGGGGGKGGSFDSDLEEGNVPQRKASRAGGGRSNGGGDGVPQRRYSQAAQIPFALPTAVSQPPPVVAEGQGSPVAESAVRSESSSPTLVHANSGSGGDGGLAVPPSMVSTSSFPSFMLPSGLTSKQAARRINPFAAATSNTGSPDS